MGFSIFHALGGAAKQYTKQVDEQRKYALDQMRETTSRIQERFDQAIADRSSKKSELEAIGRQLEASGLSPDQALVVLGQGQEKAKELAARIEKTAALSNGKFNASDIITLANPDATGVDLSTGIDNLMGIVSSTPMAGGLEFESQYSKKQWDNTRSNLEAQYGMSYDQIRNIAYGNFEQRGGVSGSIDASSLYEDERLSRRADLATIRGAEAGATIKEAEAGVAGKRTQLEIAALQSRVRQEQFTEENMESVRAEEVEKHKTAIAAARANTAGQIADNAIKLERANFAERLVELEIKKLEVDAAADTDDNILKLEFAPASSGLSRAIKTMADTTYPGEVSYDANGAMLINELDPEVKQAVQRSRDSIVVNFVESAITNFANPNAAITAAKTYAPFDFAAFGDVDFSNLSDEQKEALNTYAVPVDMKGKAKETVIFGSDRKPYVVTVDDNGNYSYDPFSQFIDTYTYPTYAK